MRPAVAAKHITKNSDEERTRKKKVKSDKKRRRRASSPSSNSSGLEDDSRGGRKSSRRHPKAKRSRRMVSNRGDGRSRPPKKRKDSKKPEKRKDRKLRLRREASVGSTSSSRDSSRSCSTCRGRSSSTGDSVSGRSRSRIPLRADRKAKSRVRGRSKGRDRGRRSRYRSCSFSSCSGRSRSRSPSPSPSPEKKYREKEKAGSKRVKTKASGEREGRNGSKDEDRDKIIRAYDDFRPSRSNDGYDRGRKLEALVPHQQASEKKELVEVAAAVGKGVRNTQGEDGAYKKGEEVISSEATSHPGKDSDDRWDDSLAREIRSMKNPSVGKNSEVMATTGSSKAEDLELILRQKALDNLRKFRGGISTSTRFLGDRRDESAGTEPCKDGGRAVDATRIRETAKSCVKSVICKPDSSTENHSTHGEDRSLEVRNDPVANQMVITRSISASDCKISNSKKGVNTQNQLTRVHDSSNEMYGQKASLAKGIRGNNRVVEGNTADGPSRTSGLDSETQNCKSDKPMVENSCGSQFEQRTFSRVHDGEKVEVSYKVYIPKKSPALARRQIQR